MIQANVHQAKTQLSKLIERAEAGEEVVIARNGKPAVRLQPVTPPKRESWLGMFAGKMDHVPTWEEWKASDREVAAMFEQGFETDEVVDGPREVLQERLDHLETLSTEALIETLIVRR